MAPHPPLKKKNNNNNIVFCWRSGRLAVVLFLPKIDQGKHSHQNEVSYNAQGWGRGGWTQPTRYHRANYRMELRWNHLHRTFEWGGSQVPIFAVRSAESAYIAFSSLAFVYLKSTHKFWQRFALALGFIPPIHFKLKSARGKWAHRIAKIFSIPVQEKLLQLLFKALFRDFEVAWTGYSQWLPFWRVILGV